MLVYFLYRIGQWLAEILPVRFAYRVAVRLSRVKFFFSRKERVFISNNLKIILGEDSPHILEYSRNIYGNFVKYLVDFFRSGYLDKEFIDKFVRIEGLENMNEALSKGKGAIGLTAHIGNWELSAQILGVLGYKISAIALTHKNPYIDKFFIKQRKLKGVNVIPVGISVRRCFSALKRNEIVGILGDRDFSGENGIFIDFLGRQMLVPRGPAVLSLKTNAAIVPAFIIRDEKNEQYFKYIFEKPIYPEKTGNEEQDIKNITEKFTRVIESYVRQYPQQWFIFREFWKAEKIDVL